LRPSDFEDVTHGFIGRVEGVEDHALPASLAAFDCRNNRLVDIALGEDGFRESVARVARRRGSDRVAVVVGTSTSGVLSCEAAYRERSSAGDLPSWFDYSRTQDLHSLATFVRTALDLSAPAFTVSTACTSSARAMIDAAHLIAAGFVDAAVVGGADSLCRLTLRGFASLELVSPEPCRPCDAARDGISVGEAAGFFLLERMEPRDSRVALLGAAASSDGYHMSSPRPDGAGAAQAIRRALAAAGLPPDAIDAVNMHGTGTRANDAAEDAAITSVFGDGMTAHSTKGFTGHTMGASGIVEAVICKLCLEQEFLPGSPWIEQPDPRLRSCASRGAVKRPLSRLVSNSLGFGGTNVSLVLGRA
jgi:3-oxoacyl-[acyl-carrier-protein] synthase-1